MVDGSGAQGEGEERQTRSSQRGGLCVCFWAQSWLSSSVGRAEELAVILVLVPVPMLYV
jgi:hypothetical protein